MRPSVSPLWPQSGSFREALGEYRAARLHACIARSHAVPSPNAAALRGRAFLRLGDARAALVAVTAVDGDRARERGELALLRAVAHGRLGDDDASRAAFGEARVYAIASMDAGLEAEVYFYEALSAFGEGLFADARATCRLALDAADMIVPYARPGGFIPRPHVVSRVQELQGLLDAAEGRYGEHLEHARDALATLDACPVADVYQQAFAFKNLATLVRDFDLQDDVRALVTRVAELAWTEEISRVEFTTFESLAWCSALRGDVVHALRLLRRASEVATSVPERVIVCVDRSTIARELGHAPMMLEELECALDASERYDWQCAPGDSRLNLLPLAQLAASIHPSRAREALERYTSIRNAMDARLVARFERRVRAEEAYTHGLVLRAEGRTAAAVERFRSAFETWNGIGYDWRAARAALELAELGAGDSFRSAVLRNVAERPASIFAGRERLVA